MDGRRHASSSPSSSSLYKGKPSGGLGKSRPSSYPPWKEEELPQRYKELLRDFPPSLLLQEVVSANSDESFPTSSDEISSCDSSLQGIIISSCSVIQLDDSREEEEEELLVFLVVVLPLGSVAYMVGVNGKDWLLLLLLYWWWWCPGKRRLLLLLCGMRHGDGVLGGRRGGWMMMRPKSSAWGAGETVRSKSMLRCRKYFCSWMKYLKYDSTSTNREKLSMFNMSLSSMLSSRSDTPPSLEK